MQTIHTLLFSVVLMILSFYRSNLMAEEESIRPKLPQIHDIRDTAQLAVTQQLPILIMFGTEECPYCYLLREDFLIPMIISGDYANKVILREIHVSYRGSLIDFSGKKVTAREFANRYKVKIFPTTVLIDAHGKKLVKNIIGITTPSLFGGTLDDSIGKAYSMLIKNSVKIR